MGTVTSADGTTIAYERSGSGPPLVLVDGAMCYRASGPMRPLAAALSSAFTVYIYDRRGRGESGDTPPYAVGREVDDLRALVDEAGGSASAYGISSGAALVLAAAADGVAFERIALYEPPFPADRTASRSYTDHLAAHLAAGRRGDAVSLFMTTVGMPPEVVAGMRQQPFWPMFEAIAPTLAYDDAILNEPGAPHATAKKVTVPTLVLDGAESPRFLREAARTTAAAIPGAAHQSLPGQTHDVSPGALAPALTSFFLPA